MLFMFGLVSAQTPQVVWQHAMGGPSGDRLQSIEPTSDGGYILAGYTESDGGDVQGYHGNTLVEDLWVVKLNANGAIEWQRCVGGVFQETGGFVKQCSDGGYIVAGSSSSTDCGLSSKNYSLDYYLVKLNGAGEVLWQKQYGGTRNDYCWGVAIAADGGYVLTGHTESIDGDVSGNHGLRDVWTIKTDAGGNLLWQKCYGGSADDVAYGISITTDGGFIINGVTESIDGNVSGKHSGQDLWALKLKADGSFDWQRALGGSGTDNGWGVKGTPDGGAILTGSTTSNDGDVSGNHSPGGQDVWVVKLSATGTTQWQHCYGGSKNDIGYGIEQAPDGGYLFTGSVESDDGDCTCNSQVLDAWVVKVSATGTLQWEKKLGGNYYDVGFGVRALADGTFVMGGFTCSTTVEGYHVPNNAGACDDYWVVKLSDAVLTPQNPVVTIGPSPASICANKTGTFTAYATYAGTNPTYIWKRNGIISPGIPGGPAWTYTASDFSDNDQLTVTATGGGGCQPTGLSTVATTTIHTNYVPVDPVLTITSNADIVCACTPTEFEASTRPAGPLVGPHYTWFLNGKALSANGPTYRSVTIKAGDKIYCNLTTDNRCLAQTAYVSNTITMGNGSTASPTVSIKGPTDAYCSGAPVTLTATALNAGTNPVYQWKLNGLDVAGANANVYTSTGFTDGDIVSCVVTPDPTFPCASGTVANSNVYNVKFASKGQPSVVVTPSATDLCSGAWVTFTATATNMGAAPTYQWKVNGSDVASAPDGTFSSGSLADGDQVSCEASVDPAGSCSLVAVVLSAPVTVHVLAQAAPALSVVADVNNVCMGQPAHFTANASNAGRDPMYVWNVNGVDLAVQHTVLERSDFHNGDIVYCTVTPGQGACSVAPLQSAPVTVIVRDTLEVHVLPADTVVFYGASFQLTGVATPGAGGSLIGYGWYPSSLLEGGGSSLTPVTTPIKDNVSFQFVVTSSNQCLARGMATVRVTRSLAMPSAFTPNGDGVNDVFRIPPGIVFDLEAFVVYDRWGQRVFSAQRLDEAWDGRVGGHAAAAGTYIYYIKGKDVKGEISVKGTVTLVR